FGIQLGVGITIAVRTAQRPNHAIYYYRVPEYWRKAEKLAFLKEKGSASKIAWQELQPDERYAWLTEGNHPEFITSFLTIGNKEAKATHHSIGDTETHTIFKIYSPGAQTNRDNWMYDFIREKLTIKVQNMIETYNAEISRWIRAGEPQDIDSFVTPDE